MTRRLVIGLTHKERGLIRCLLTLVADGSLEHPTSDRDIADRLIARLASADELSPAEVREYDYAAGNLLDSDPDEWRKQRGASRFNAAMRCRFKIGRLLGAIRRTR